MNNLNILLTENFFYVTCAFGVIFLIMLFIIISMKMDISAMQRRYRKMMGDEDGVNLENMLNEHADNVKKINQDLRLMDDEVASIKKLLEKAITRIAIIRYDAFEDTSSDLSFSLALLDDNKTGVIISSLYGREFSRTYAKPIVNGDSPQYKLTQEEEQVLREAAFSPVRR